MLSRCEAVIGSVYSPFAVIAAEMGSVNYEIVGTGGAPLPARLPRRKGSSAP